MKADFRIFLDACVLANFGVCDLLLRLEPQQMTVCLGEIAGKRNIEVQDVLIRLGKILPAFSQRLLDDLG